MPNINSTLLPSEAEMRENHSRFSKSIKIINGCSLQECADLWDLKVPKASELGSGPGGDTSRDTEVLL